MPANYFDERIARSYEARWPELGVPVHGIDLSPEMVAELRAKPGSGDVGVTAGDFATTRVEGTFRLAYLLRNTIMYLLQRLPPGETVRPFTVTPSHLAGLTLRGRWSDWARSPFTSDSTQHVSVWEKPG